MRKMIKKFAHFISVNNNYSIEQEELIEYSMRIFIFETLKILLLFTFFSLLKLTYEGLILIIVMSSTKPFIGGYHEDSQVKCFIATLIIDSSIMYLSISTSFTIPSIIILGSISLFAMWHRVPVINPAMPITKEKLLNRNRALGLTISSFYVLLSILLADYNVTSNLIIWTVIFQCLLLFNKKSK